ncbi:hypothetical protein GCK72_021608 [Caenorhabditis remanei]|uniref:Uncharacterized protein n=1 Tax=Caenorhabditis remanei TaxID=31234 RepID=A0A6A5GIM1_CAERE|nr:hypothetical protein GCK72_021608 [Caenorhabditis remanei]KAF1755040.1 hypothetical protein GCK72_021608 [Caenorhabditis remanei]
MGQTSSKTLQVPQQPIVQQQQSESLVQTVQSVSPGFGRAQTMLDVTQAQLASSTTDVAVGGLPRSTSDPALNTSSQTACQKSYQQALEWGRNEQFLKLAHTFHTNNY